MKIKTTIQAGGGTGGCTKRRTCPSPVTGEQRYARLISAKAWPQLSSPSLRATAASACPTHLAGSAPRHHDDDEDEGGREG